MEKNVAVSIESDASLRCYNTFGMDVKASQLLRLTSENELPEVLRYASAFEGRVLFLGGGSNILLTRNWEGLVIKIETKGIEVLDEDSEFVYVKAQAGEVWDDFVNFCVERNFGGIENLTLIPGCVGSSPIQNIGAYGVELKDVFYMLEAVSLRTGEFREFYKDECNFGYRYSVFKGECKNSYLILSVIFRLQKRPKFNLSYGAVEEEVKRIGAGINIRTISQAITNIRRSKLPDPSEIGNSGSFFKNPLVSVGEFEALIKSYPNLRYFRNNDEYKLAAGWLIESCGWKGYREGDAGVHSLQALVLVNYGSATGNQIKELSEKITESVFNKYGVKLEAEVNIL
jgi:UDP-N-acetylmuramate dehydrogenase